jgi:hypothetical protein
MLKTLTYEDINRFKRKTKDFEKNIELLYFGFCYFLSSTISIKLEVSKFID